MTASGPDRLRRHLREPQHRNAYLLMANTGLAAAAGLAFWLALTRVLGLPPAEVGLGYAVVAVGTTVGVLARGGLDTALLRTVPRASRRSARRLAALATALGAGIAVTLAAGMAAGSSAGASLGSLSLSDWAAAAGLGVLLVAVWLQDAYFLAEGDASAALVRTLVASAVRVAAPFALVALALPQPVPLAWGLALVASLLAGGLLLRRLPARAGAEVPPSDLLASAHRNMASSVAEFLPGLLLPPLVLAMLGAEQAAYYGMAFTMASLLFLAAAAVGRSALAEVSRGATPLPAAVRRGALQCLAVLGPGAALAIVLAPWLLGVFGAGYAEAGTLPFRLLCLSVLAVAPASLYIAVLRVRERTVPLALLPLATIALLLALAPALGREWGLPGVAAAWGLANLPTGLWSVARLAREARDPSSSGPARPAPSAEGA